MHRLSWVNFHTFRHTWATWMRRYGGADVQGLVATGGTLDRQSVTHMSSRAMSGTAWKAYRQTRVETTWKRQRQMANALKNIKPACPPRTGRTLFHTRYCTGAWMWLSRTTWLQRAISLFNNTRAAAGERWSFG